MAGRAADLIEIPATLWQRAAMTEALSNRDMGRVFQLVRQYAGASQTQLAIACAFLQDGKHENAYLALRAARDIAPEEIAGRPAVRRLVRDLITSAPPSVQRQAEDFARGLGVSR
jgi:hypothetical protein